METNDRKLQGDVAKLAEMIQGIRIAMLTTSKPDGELWSRPMAVQDKDFDGRLWFFTKEHSPKVGEIQSDRKVSVTFSDPEKSRYVVVAGTATVVKDHDQMATLWNPFLKAWFPDGLEDPELSLLKVDVTQAEYWDTPPSKVVQLVGFAKAAISGKDYDPGDHQKLDLEKGYVS